MPESQASKSQQPRSLRALLRAILMLDDTPHSIALGTAIGMFVGMTPTVGVQMLIVLCIAFLTRPFFHFNRVAAVLTVYVTNPLTIVPVYWFNYCVGTLFVQETVTYERFSSILEYRGFSEWTNTVSHLLSDVGLPLLTGSLIVAVICSLGTYPAMIWLTQRVRQGLSDSQSMNGGGSSGSVSDKAKTTITDTEPVATTRS
jgi:uncharacterized protein